MAAAGPFPGPEVRPPVGRAGALAHSLRVALVTEGAPPRASICLLCVLCVLCMCVCFFHIKKGRTENSGGSWGGWRGQGSHSRVENLVISVHASDR